MGRRVSRANASSGTRIGRMLRPASSVPGGGSGAGSPSDKTKCPGSNATMAFSTPGAAMAANQPYLPLLEWVTKTAGPVRPNNAANVSPMKR